MISIWFLKTSICIFVDGYLYSLKRWYIIDKIPSSFEYCLILFSSELEFKFKNKIKMNKLIIDVVNEKIFLMIITYTNTYNITYENNKINYEKLTEIISKFLISYDLKITDINKIYINNGPGSFAGIRNSLSVVKAIHMVNKIDYFCYSLSDFRIENEVKYENIPKLCEEFKIKKNLINPIYLS